MDLELLRRLLDAAGLPRPEDPDNPELLRATPAWLSLGAELADYPFNDPPVGHTRPERRSAAADSRGQVQMVDFGSE
jgi:hypothetical protein